MEFPDELWELIKDFAFDWKRKEVINKNYNKVFQVISSRYFLELDIRYKTLQKL